MPIELHADAPTLLLRREAFERAGLTRVAVDARWNLTDREFQVEGGLIAIGPLYGVEALTELVDYLESEGLSYFDDFFEFSGNWPRWVRVMGMRDDP